MYNVCKTNYRINWIGKWQLLIKKKVWDLLRWHRIFAIAEKLLRANGYKVIKDAVKWNNPLATPLYAVNLNTCSNSNQVSSSLTQSDEEPTLEFK